MKRILIAGVLAGLAAAMIGAGAQAQEAEPGLRCASEAGRPANSRVALAGARTVSGRLIIHDPVPTASGREVIGFAFNHPDGSRTGVKFTTTADRHPDGGPTATVAVIGRFGPNDRLLSESPLFQFGIGAADFEIRFGADRIELTVVAAASRNAGEIPERQTTSLAGPVPAPTEAVLICPEGDYYLLNLDPQFPRPVFDPAPETSRR